MDCSQGRAKLMGYSRQEFILCSDGVAKFFFSSFFIGDVDDGPDEPDGCSVGILAVERNFSFFLDPPDGSVPPHDAIFNLVIAFGSRINGAGDSLIHTLAVVRMYHLQKKLEIYVCRQAKNQSGPLISRQSIGRNVPIPCAQFGRFGSESQGLFAVA